MWLSSKKIRNGMWHETSLQNKCFEVCEFFYWYRNLNVENIHKNYIFSTSELIKKTISLFDVLYARFTRSPWKAFSKRNKNKRKVLSGHHTWRVQSVVVVVVVVVGDSRCVNWFGDCATYSGERYNGVVRCFIIIGTRVIDWVHVGSCGLSGARDICDSVSVGW
jgi:hypothetical protein